MMLAGCGETKNSTSLGVDTSVNAEQKQLIDDNAKDITENTSQDEQENEGNSMTITIDGAEMECI